MNKVFLADPGSDAPAIGRSMKVYLAADGLDRKPLRPLRPLRILLSYHYYKDEDVAKLLHDCFEGIELDVFADSGAYSAWSVGQPVPEDAYIAWVQKWAACFDAVAGPDVIGDPVQTFAATERMRSQVTAMPVLPVFHVGEDWTWLKKIVDTGADYIAFGGMVPYTRQRKLLDSWLRKAWSFLPETMRVHGFGMTTWPLLIKYPWYSVDSSSWTSGFRYAQIALFDSQRGRFIGINMGDRKELLANAKLLSTYGMRPSEATADGYDRDLLCGVCVESWQRAEAWLSDRHVYLSCGSVPAGSGSGHASSVGAGVRAYLSAGSEKIEGAPNRPEGIARDPARYLRDSKVFLSVGAGAGAGNHPVEIGRALRKDRS